MRSSGWGGGRGGKREREKKEFGDQKEEGGGKKKKKSHQTNEKKGELVVKPSNGPTTFRRRRESRARPRGPPSSRHEQRGRRRRDRVSGAAGGGHFLRPAGNGRGGAAPGGVRGGGGGCGRAPPHRAAPLGEAGFAPGPFAARAPGSAPCSRAAQGHPGARPCAGPLRSVPSAGPVPGPSLGRQRAPAPSWRRGSPGSELSAPRGCSETAAFRSFGTAQRPLCAVPSGSVRSSIVLGFVVALLKGRALNPAVRTAPTSPFSHVPAARAAMGHRSSSQHRSIAALRAKNSQTPQRNVPVQRPVGSTC